MKLDDVKISRAIVERYTAKLLDSLESDVAIVGGGPAGLTAAYYLAKAGKRVTVLERALALGGGMWGGGMMFSEIVLQEGGQRVLRELGVRTVEFGDGYHTADSVEAVATLCSRASQAGARLFNLLSVEDVMLTEGRVTGLVINWTAVERSRLHVDPLTMRSRHVVDASGHTAEVAALIQRKSGAELQTPTGRMIGERPMWAEEGERTTVENTREIFPGVFCAGMAANNVFGGPRMGPIFGGMLMSGRKVAELILERG